MGSLVKRRLSGADDSDAHISKRAANTSSAAKFNKNVIKKLERALEKDPEVDLTAIFPSDYKSRLVQRRTNKGARLFLIKCDFLIIDRVKQSIGYKDLDAGKF